MNIITKRLKTWIKYSMLEEEVNHKKYLISRLKCSLTIASHKLIVLQKIVLLEKDIKLPSIKSPELEKIQGW